MVIRIYFLFINNEELPINSIKTVSFLFASEPEHINALHFHFRQFI